MQLDVLLLFLVNIHEFWLESVYKLLVTLTGISIELLNRMDFTDYSVHIGKFSLPVSTNSSNFHLHE